MNDETTMQKGLLPNLVDPNHTYVFRSGDLGLRVYWYVDMRGDYWAYTNAPEDHKDYDPCAGVPIFAKNQPTLSESPEFFTTEGRKRHRAVPPEIIPDRNEDYDPLDPKNIWFEVFVENQKTSYVYLDSDIRENIDLFVQYQLRVTDAALPSFRKFAVDKFASSQSKDKVIGAILILCDQGLYTVDSLVNATVGDIKFVDDTVILLGRKLLCDPALLDFLTSISLSREDSSPLFQIDTYEGAKPLSIEHINSIMHYLRVHPTYLLGWHASHYFSKIVSKLLLDNVPSSKVEGLALSELKRVFTSHDVVEHLVDYKVRCILLDNYKNAVSKSWKLPRFHSDDFSTLLVLSDLDGLKKEEQLFSTWLHLEPMHDISPEEQERVLDMVADEDPADGAESAEDVDDSLPDAGQEDVGAVDVPEGTDVGTTDKEQV